MSLCVHDSSLMDSRQCDSTRREFLVGRAASRITMAPFVAVSDRTAKRADRRESRNEFTANRTAWAGALEKHNFISVCLLARQRIRICRFSWAGCLIFALGRSLDLPGTKTFSRRLPRGHTPLIWVVNRTTEEENHLVDALACLCLVGSALVFAANGHMIHMIIQCGPTVISGVS